VTRWLADPVFVDAGAERNDRAHIFVAGREVLVERHGALDQRRRSVIDDLEIGGADRNRIDAEQNFRMSGRRNWLHRKLKLAGAAQNPRFHRCRNRKIRVRFHAGSVIHATASH
jgi:hypothetical protein